MTKVKQRHTIYLSDAAQAIVREIMRQNPWLEGNRSAAIRKVLYDWENEHAPNLRAPEEDTMAQSENRFEAEFIEEVTHLMNQATDPGVTEFEVGTHLLDAPDYVATVDQAVEWIEKTAYGDVR